MRGFKQRMDELNYFLKDMKAPEELAARAREHVRSTRGLYKKLSCACRKVRSQK